MSMIIANFAALITNDKNHYATESCNVCYYNKFTLRCPLPRRSTFYM